jgi:hypothetical protein
VEEKEGQEEEEGHGKTAPPLGRAQAKMEREEEIVKPVALHGCITR